MMSTTLFDLCGGHPALDFVNSLDNRFREDGPNEMLVSYGDLLRFLDETGLLSEAKAHLLRTSVGPEAAARALQSTRELREAAAAVFYASLEGNKRAPHDLRVLERHFLEASRHRELEWAPEAASGSASPPARLAWHWGRFATDPDLPVWILAQSVSDILLSDQMSQVHTCAVDTCRWLFLDTSKNHSRRWCNMRVCGNRMKARRYQARRES